jgi:hypothetical protein
VAEDFVDLLAQGFADDGAAGGYGGGQTQSVRQTAGCHLCCGMRHDKEAHGCRCVPSVAIALTWPWPRQPRARSTLSSPPALLRHAW